MAGKPRGTAPMQVVAVRLPLEVAERVEWYRKYLQDANPAGIDISTTDAVRALLLRGLEAVERSARR